MPEICKHTKNVILLTLSTSLAYADKPGLTSLKVSFTNVICLPKKMEKRKMQFPENPKYILTKKNIILVIYLLEILISKSYLIISKSYPRIWKTKTSIIDKKYPWKTIYCAVHLNKEWERLAQSIFIKANRSLHLKIVY